MNMYINLSEFAMEARPQVLSQLCRDAELFLLFYIILL